MPTSSTQWLLYAIASGACAAINGVFAKLTTTKLTTAWAGSISNLLGLDSQSAIVEYAIRASFFLMNLTFNGVMWGLFTRALTLSSSTVRVSVINTSANFMITAILGAMVFSEELPGLWWIGAGLLVAGSVIIGRREEHTEDSRVSEDVNTTGASPPVGNSSANDTTGDAVSSGREKVASFKPRDTRTRKDHA